MPSPGELSHRPGRTDRQPNSDRPTRVYSFTRREVFGRCARRGVRDLRCWRASRSLARRKRRDSDRSRCREFFSPRDRLPVRTAGAYAIACSPTGQQLVARIVIGKAGGSTTAELQVFDTEIGSHFRQAGPPMNELTGRGWPSVLIWE